MEYIVLSIPVFLVLIGAEVLWSWWNGRRIYRFNDFVSNLGCGIGSQVVGAFTKTAIYAAYLMAYDQARLFTLPNTALTWVGAFLLVDLLYYWFHRLSHEVNFLWAAHIVHHQSEEYNLSVALRQSWWQGLFSWWFYLPLAFLGFHPLVIVTVGAVNTLYQFWIHTTAIGRMGWLELILNTPSHHRVHHGSDPKYLDRNHAGTLIIWDRLFGTFQREEEEPVYGITTPLGAWDPVRANFHYWGELIAMARRTRAWTDKVRIFLKGPGWRPTDLGGPVIPKRRDRMTFPKFNNAIPPMVNGYVAAQFALLLGVTSFFLFRQQELGPWVGRSIAVLIIGWVMSLGLLLEGRKAFALEGLRILAMAGISIALSYTFEDARYWMVTLAVCGASMLHLVNTIRQLPSFG